MDVFLEQRSSVLTSSSVLDRLVFSLPLKSTSVEELIRETVCLRLRGIRFVSVRRQQVLRIGQELLLEILEDAGIAVSCVGFAGGFTGSLGFSFSDATHDARRALDLASELNARFVIVVPGSQGLHTYRHAERTVRMGYWDVHYYAEQRQVQLLVPTESILQGLHDVFSPRGCSLNWVRQLNLRTIRPMIVVRGAASAFRLPRGWRESLDSGGCLRICHHCSSYEDNVRLVIGVLQYLNRRSEADIPQILV